MRNGDISNKPSYAVAFNVAALCNLPAPVTGLTKFFKSNDKPVPMNDIAVRALRRLNRGILNTILLVEKPELWKFAENMVKEYPDTLAVKAMFMCHTPDHYALILNTYDIAYTFWYGEEVFLHYDHVITEARHEAWWSLLSRIDEERI